MAIANGTCVGFCNQANAHFCLPWVRLWGNRGECHMDEKRIQCLSNASQNIPIYLQPFIRAIARYWSEIATFFYPLHLTLPLGCSHWNSGKKFGPQKTRSMAASENSLTMFRSRFAAYDRRTDRRPAYINNVRSMTDAR